MPEHGLSAGDIGSAVLVHRGAAQFGVQVLRPAEFLDLYETPYDEN